MRGRTVLLALLIVLCASSASAQRPPPPRAPAKVVPRPERYRISVNAGQQATSTSFAEEQQFEQYFEQGTFTFERTLGKSLFFDAGVAVRVWRKLHAGAALSIFEDAGTGDVTARVPHPLYFEEQRTTTGEVPNVTRREVGQHISAGWAFPDVDGLDVLVFGGPSIFTTEQLFVTMLQLSLDEEVYPFDALAFPGTVTAKSREHVVGYNVGVDMMWRFNRKVGAGLLVRYTSGKKDFVPTGRTPVEVDVGGLHIGGGLRLVF